MALHSCWFNQLTFTSLVMGLIQLVVEMLWSLKFKSIDFYLCDPGFRPACVKLVSSSGLID